MYNIQNSSTTLLRTIHKSLKTIKDPEALERAKALRLALSEFTGKRCSFTGMLVPYRNGDYN